jgi:hypothetical protein
MKPVIFISHSTRPGDQSEVVLRELVDKLSIAFEPWWDRRSLQPGDDWNGEIVMALGQARGAVILLSRRALESSDWVQYEASVLAWRYAIARLQNPPAQFSLLVVPLDQITQEEISNSPFGPMGLTRIQLVPEDTPAQIAERVLENIAKLQEVAVDTPWQRMESELARWLRQVPVDFLLQASESAGHAISDRSPAGLPERLVGALLAAQPDQVINAFNVLAPVMTNDKGNETVVNIVTAMWIKARAAAPVAEAVAHPDVVCALVLNCGTPQYTPVAYIRRAVLREVDWKIARGLNKTGGDLDRLVEDVRRELMSAICFVYGEDDDQLLPYLEDQQRKGKPVFIVVSGVADQELIWRLKDEFPMCTLLLAPSNEALVASNLNGCVKLLEAIQRDTEQQFYWRYVDACRLLGVSRTKPGSQNVV